MTAKKKSSVKATSEKKPTENIYEVMKQEMQRFGLVYLPDDILETLDDLVGLEQEKEMMYDFFEALQGFRDIRENLLKAKLTPNLSLLLYGPPGTGKTSLTLAFCKQYNLPACVIQSDRLVSSMLGDTVKNIRTVFELGEKWAEKLGFFVLFFDELDSITSERSNVHEVGEVKRAVVSFLQIMDQLNAKAVPLAIIGATNHEKQLDSAVWRRFTYHLELKFPGPEVRHDMIMKFIARLQLATIDIDEELLQKLQEEKQIFLKIRNNPAMKEIRDENKLFAQYIGTKVKKQDSLLYNSIGYTGADLSRAFRIAFLKVIKNKLLKYEDLYNAIKAVGGTAAHVNQQRILSGNGIDYANNSRNPRDSQDEKSLRSQNSGDSEDIIKTFK